MSWVGGIDGKRYGRWDIMSFCYSGTVRTKDKRLYDYVFPSLDMSVVHVLLSSKRHAGLACDHDISFPFPSHADVQEGALSPSCQRCPWMSFSR